MAIADVVAFWKQAVDDGSWNTKDPAFDHEFKERFLDQHMAAAARQCEHWMETAQGALALMILLDQFPRNAFRSTAHMYGTDGLARMYAHEAERRGHMMELEPRMQLFLVFPFTHSEAIDDQDISVLLSERLTLERLEKAKGHREIVRRFGRFPHRNRLLGRQSTAEEEGYLAEGGFAG